MGTVAPYWIGISGSNLNASIEYDNGAKLGYGGDGVLSGDDDLVFQATGTFRFKLAEDVVFTDKGLDVRIIGTESGVAYTDRIFLDIDLPEGLEGQVNCFESSLTIDGNIGWIPYPGNIYRTTHSPPQPLLDIHARGTTVRATLKT